MSLLKRNPIEPPWYGPVCPVVWEGRRREASPYPDQHGFQRLSAITKCGVQNLAAGDVIVPDGKVNTFSSG